MAFPASGMQPVQSFQDGGMAERLEITPPPVIAESPVSSEAPPPPAPERPSAPVPAQAGAFLDRSSRAGAALGGIYDLGRSLFGARFRGMTGESGDRPLVLPQEAPLPPPRPQQPGEATIPPEELARMRDADRSEESGSYRGRPAPAPASAVPSVSTSLDEIRSRREAREEARTAAERRENALLALMQAGFATAAGTSPYALSNIGAGGQAGIAAFANLERSRREDAAARRREQLQRELATAQLQKDPDQIRTLAMLGGWSPEQGREGLNAAVTRGLQVQRSMEKDPELIRTFQVLGGGDVRKGFEIFNADKKLQAAIAVTKDITATEEDRRAANEYIRTQLTQARTGGSSAFPGFSATPVR